MEHFGPFPDVPRLVEAGRGSLLEFILGGCSFVWFFVGCQKMVWVSEGGLLVWGANTRVLGI